MNHIEEWKRIKHQQEQQHFILEYCYHSFCLYGKPRRTLKQVLRLITNITTMLEGRNNG